MTKKAVINEQGGKTGEFYVYYDGNGYVYYWHYQGPTTQVRRKLRELENKKTIRPSSDYTEIDKIEYSEKLKEEEAETLIEQFAEEIENSVEEVWSVEIKNE
jgi:hypothetical protein